MNSSQPALSTSSRSSQPQTPTGAQLFIPPVPYRQYQWTKVGGAGIFLVIFTGWLIIQWSNPVMRWVTLGLGLMTLWITVESIVRDIVRARGRQLAIEPGVLTIESPDRRQQVQLQAVAYARWIEEPADQAGLWFYDAQQHVLGHIDDIFLENQAEARAFLGWARRQQQFDFDVQWPASSV